MIITLVLSLITMAAWEHEEHFPVAFIYAG